MWLRHNLGPEKDFKWLEKRHISDNRMVITQANKSEEDTGS